MLLIDVSGSMEPYADALLRFALLAGQHLLGDLDGKNQDAVHLAVLIGEGLAGEIEVARGSIGRQREGHFPPAKGLPAGVYLVEQGHKALLLRFGQHVGQPLVLRPLPEPEQAARPLVAEQEAKLAVEHDDSLAEPLDGGERDGVARVAASRCRPGERQSRS